jgi:hypothetical protein
MVHSCPIRVWRKRLPEQLGEMLRLVPRLVRVTQDPANSNKPADAVEHVDAGFKLTHLAWETAEVKLTHLQ